MTKTRRKLLIFSPYSGIWQHQLQQTQFMTKYDFSAYDISVVSCGGLLNRHCAVYESFGYKYNQKEQDQICRKCINSSRLTTASLKVEETKLGDFLTDEEKSNRIEILDSIKTSELGNFSFAGLEIARLTAFETFIKYKKTDFQLSKEEEQHWRNGIYQGLVVQIAAERIIDAVQPDLVLAYSPQYAATSVFAEICQLNGVPLYFLEGSIHLGERYKALHLWNWERHGLVDPAIELYEQTVCTIQNKSETKRISEHLKITEQARSFGAYSQKKSRKYDLFSDFKIADGKKVVLCALSSTDEIYSGFVIGKIPLERYRGRVFHTQYEWIKETIRIAEKYNDIFFIIRIHPRMVSNKREDFDSPEVNKWRDLLAVLPENMAVDYPEDKRSISNYFAQIDLLITGWSSTAIDAMAVGVPAISCDESLSWFPKRVVYACKSVTDYELTILMKLKNGKNPGNRKLAFDWLGFRLLNGTISVSGRLIDRLKLNNWRLIELFYAFATKYLFGLLVRLELALIPKKKEKIPYPVQQVLDGDETSLFHSR